ncbi:MAG: T9SS type A sorting domain-containing protein [Bacteroidota bacterium]
MRLSFILSILLFSLILFPESLIAQEACGTVETPETQAYWEATRPAFEEWLRNRPSVQSRTPDKVYLQPHIVTRSDGSGGLSMAAFNAGIAYTQARYLEMNVEMVICEINYIADTDAYDYQAGADEGRLIINNVPNRINVYFVTNPTTGGGGAVCGYTYRPGGPRIVIMNYACTASGKTLSHEIGHYLSLYHTHGTTNNGTTDEFADGSNCSTAGDRICDTPADPNLSGVVDGNCNYVGSATDGKGQAYNPDPSNIMSYARNACRNRFTDGQYAQMRFSLENDRPELIQGPQCNDADKSCLLVTNLDKVGLGSLPYAINCANELPGPDTIRFQLPEGLNPRILLDNALPTITDDGTFIDATLPNYPAGTRLLISGINMGDDAEGIFTIEGRNTTIAHLDITQYQASAGINNIDNAVINIATGVERFLLDDLNISLSSAAIQTGRSSGIVSNSSFQFCQFAIRYEDDASALYVTKNSFQCVRRAVFDIAGNLVNLPPTPVITSVSGGNLQGTAEPGATVEVFANEDGDCLGTPCQGIYVGSTNADQAGNWSVDIEPRVLRSYTATATRVIGGGTAYTSELATCQSLLEGADFWLYPNPVTGSTLNFELKGKVDSVQIRIVNSVGQSVYQNQFEMSSSVIKESIDLGDWLAAGVYVFELTKGTEMYRQKIVVQ